MKVSIIIPVYNVEKYLEECLESVVKQSLKEVEIICIDDGSDDKSKFILEKYRKENDNLTVITQKNEGISSARNKGISVAKGEYIYFLDSDDYLELNAMDICYRESKRNNLDMLIMDAECFQDKELTNKSYYEKYERKNILIENIVSGKEFFVTCQDKEVFKSPVWLSFYKREFIINNELYFVKNLLHEDELYTILSYISAEKVKYIPKKIINRRLRNNSLMTSGLSEKNIESYIYIIDKIFELSKESELEYEVIEALRSYAINLLQYTLIYCNKFISKIIRRKIDELIFKNNEIIEIDIDIQSKSLSLLYKNIDINYDRTSELANYKNKKKIFYMMIPTHGNLGDQAIAYSTKCFLKDNYSEYETIEINYEDTYKYLNVINEVLNPEDLIVLHGGGNMGDHYIWEEEARRYIIANFRENIIISFPQTMFFSNNNYGEEQLKISSDIYNSHNNLILIGREQESYYNMSKIFNKVNVKLCPDIVFYLNNKLKNDTLNNKRKYITTCLREDKETYYNLIDKKNIINELSKEYNMINTDTIVNYRVDTINREKEIFKLLRIFTKSKIVITDRLHGMIFAAITKTPCIVLRSLDHKVMESYRWIENLNYIKIIDELDIRKIKMYIDELNKIDKFDDYDFRDVYKSKLLIEYEENIEKNSIS